MLVVMKFYFVVSEWVLALPGRRAQLRLEKVPGLAEGRVGLVGVYQLEDLEG